jgi:hemerythrin-like domain-containing protein
MCEYCGCQDIASIGELTREHDAVVAEIAEVRAFLRDHHPEGAAKASRRIAEILEPHTAVEEGGLFPLMREEFPEHIGVLESEHRVLEDVLAEAREGTPSDPDWPGRLLAALELLRDHILKEQDGVFPASLAVLDTDGWEQVEAVRARAGSAIEPESATGSHHPENPHYPTTSQGHRHRW